MAPRKADLAGKDYWDGIWADARVPEPIDPGRGGIGNFANLAFHRFFTRAFESQLTRGRKLVEVGCARSAWLPYFASEFGFVVSGIDYSQTGCVQAERALASAGRSGRIYCADVFDPPGELVHTQDVVVSFGVVEHFADTAACLSALNGLLAPGGTIITVIPNLTGLLGWVEKLLDRRVYDLHMQLSAERLRSAHQEAGLHVAKCEYLMVTNWGVLNLGSWPCGPIRSRVEHQISHITRLFWLAERSQPGIIRPNRITSPYVVCVASSRGRAPTNA